MDKDPRPIVDEPRHRGDRDRVAPRPPRAVRAPTRDALRAGARRQAVADLSGRLSPNAHRSRRLRRACTASSTRPSTSARSTRSRSTRAMQVPGSLMSYRDPHAMLECLFYVNELPGGEAHHDGGMKGRDHAAAARQPDAAADRRRTGGARPAAAAAEARGRVDGAPAEGIAEPGAVVGGRRGDRAAGHRQAGRAPAPDRKRPTPRSRRSIRRSASSCRAISIRPRKLGKAAALVPPGHSFEMSIQEQAATLMTDGLSFVADVRS